MLQRSRRLVRAAMVLCFSATFVLLVVAVSLKSLSDTRLRLVAMFAGLAFGGALLDFLLGCWPRSRARVIAGAIATGISQVFFLLLVWGWATEPALWRVWWTFGFASLLIAHLEALAMIRSGRNDPAERGAPVLSVVFTLLLMGLAARPREDLLSSPGALHGGAIALAGLGTLISCGLVWRRFVAGKVQLSGIWRRSRFAVAALLLVATFFAGYYLGRVSNPPPSPLDVFPSAIRGLPPAELERNLQDDLGRLKTVAAGIQDLARQAEEAWPQLSRKLAAEKRTIFLPEEDDHIRQIFMTYLSYRTALLRMLATYAGFESVRDPGRRARCFLVGYAAGMTVFENSLKLVNTYGANDVVKRKLNEPEPIWDIPANMFNELYLRVTSKRNIELHDEMKAYVALHREKWRSAGVFPAADLDWLTRRIDDATSYVEENSIPRAKAYLDLLKDKVRDDLYTPVYAVQSMVSEWIGDTRIAGREPLIRVEDIERHEGKLRAGDILLERRNWFLSNAFLPGFWPHAALYVGRIEDLERLGIADRPEIRSKYDEFVAKAADGRDHTVIEAVSEGVIFNSLTHSMHADYVAVLRPRLDDGKIGEAIVRAFSHHGKPYDFEFDFETSHQLVCTEVVFRAYEGFLHFETRNVMGRVTLPALDIARKFAVERDREDRQLDLVLFLDGDGVEPAGVSEFCASIDRPPAFYKK